MPEIYTTTDVIAEAAQLVGRSHQAFVNGSGVPADIERDLEDALRILRGLVDFAVDAENERKRREDEYERTGTITFPLGQLPEELTTSAVNEAALRLGLDPADVTVRSSEMRVRFVADAEEDEQ